MKHTLRYLTATLFFFLFFGKNDAQTFGGMVNTSIKISNYNVVCGCIAVPTVQGFATGDRVIIMQMQGATAGAQSNTLFGSVSDYGKCGKLEMNTIASIYGNTITLQTQLVTNFDFANGSVQLVKVASGSDVVVNSLTAKPWDGESGGVIAIEASNTLTINGDINASGRGFRGGVSNVANLNCNQHEYSYPATSLDGAAKGEGVAKLIASSSRGRGAWSNGGGGGNNHNAGGGGGGNAFTGGFGGYNWNNCTIKNDEATRGVGGYGLNYSIFDIRVYMGGGGGAGHRNDNNPSNGSNGGGIVILIAKTISSNGGAIITRGADAEKVVMDGAGGGGAGGTVVLLADNIANNLTIDISGGKGGDARNPHGPGGGGSAGVLLMKQDQLPSQLRVIGNGGTSGMNYELGGAAVGFVQNPNGATNGEEGLIVTSLRIQQYNQQSNALHINAGDDKVTCKNSPVQLSASSNGGVAPFAYTWSPSTGLNDSTISNPIVRAEKSGVKILGNGELTKKLTVKAAKFSKSAEAAIVAKGGSVEVI